MSDKDTRESASVVDEDCKINILGGVRSGILNDLLRIPAFFLLGLFFLYTATPVAVFFNEPNISPFGMWVGLGCMGAGAGQLLRRMYFPYLSLSSIAKIACRSPEGAGRVFLGVCLVIAALVLSMTSAKASEIPANALKYAPVLGEEATKYWPEFKGNYHILAGQVEQESCITLTHKKCWTPYAELKTTREWGAGLGQITKTERFDSLAELKTKYKVELAGWGWGETLYDPHYQLRGLVLMNKGNYQRILDTANTLERTAMMLVAYNGGLGRVMSDRKLCDATAGCNSRFWFDHAEKTSRLPKVAVTGYGKSFFQINREYPHLIMEKRSLKYKQLFA
jgi:hypothetical protein